MALGAEVPPPQITHLRAHCGDYISMPTERVNLKKIDGAH